MLVERFRMSSRFAELLLAKSKQEGRRISNAEVARETGLSEFTVGAFFRDTLKEYPSDATAALCVYLGVGVNRLLVVVDAANGREVEPAHIQLPELQAA